MNPDLLFEICSLGVMPIWLLLVVAPSWRWTDREVHRIWIPGVMCLVHVLRRTHSLQEAVVVKR